MLEQVDVGLKKQVCILFFITLKKKVYCIYNYNFMIKLKYKICNTYVS